MCTAAERQYALEAWRHLDPNALLIPMAQRQQRFVCVPSGRLKDIADVIGLPGHPWLAPSTAFNCPNSAMPLAIILDDRIEVRPSKPMGYPCMPPVRLFMDLDHLGTACVSTILVCVEMSAHLSWDLWLINALEQAAWHTCRASATSLAELPWCMECYKHVHG